MRTVGETESLAQVFVTLNDDSLLLTNSVKKTNSCTMSVRMPWPSVTYSQPSTVWRIVTKFGIGLLYRKMSSKHEFRENKPRKFRTFRTGIREPLNLVIFRK